MRAVRRHEQQVLDFTERWLRHSNGCRQSHSCRVRQRTTFKPRLTSQSEPNSRYPVELVLAIKMRRHLVHEAVHLFFDLRVRLEPDVEIENDLGEAACLYFLKRG